jgi:hypothetical protein
MTFLTFCLPYTSSEIRLKVHPCTSAEALYWRYSLWKGAGVHVSFCPFLTTELEGGERSASRPGRSLTGKNSVPIVQEGGWAPEPVWTDVENLTPTGILFPDRPARNQTLLRLRYPEPSEERQPVISNTVFPE